MSSAPEVTDEHDPLAVLHLQIQQHARQLEMVAGAVDEMETVFRDPPRSHRGHTARAVANEGPAAESAPFDFATLYTWVHIHVATITERKVSKSSGSESGVGVRWYTRWYEHDEAIARLEALRRAWEEHVVTHGAGMSSWYISHYDPHITALTSAGGPFWQCSPGYHQRARPIGHELLDE